MFLTMLESSKFLTMLERNKVPHNVGLYSLKILHCEELEPDTLVVPHNVGKQLVPHNVGINLVPHNVGKKTGSSRCWLF